MAVFTIADLHLSSSAGHPMDVFGDRWKDYTNKICERWRAVVGKDDTVILPGDLSWAMSLEEAREDFALLDALPGKKLLGKGNHDFWWTTAAKLHRFFEENHFSTFSLLYNNAAPVENFIVAGTRGWFLEEERQQTVGEVDFEKIKSREIQRLKISLDAAARLRDEAGGEREIIVFLHFPPVWNGEAFEPLVDLMLQYGVRRCYCGHIHGTYHVPASWEHRGIQYHLISSDFLQFTPLRVL